MSATRHAQKSDISVVAISAAIEPIVIPLM